MKIKDYFAPFIEYKIKQGCSDHTIEEYRRFIRETLSCVAEKRIKDLRVTDKAAIMQLGRMHGHWGEQRAVSTFKNLVQYLYFSGHDLPFRCEDILLPKALEKEQYFLTPDDFEDFVSKMPDTFYGLRDRTLYELLWSTGLRVGEALAIDVGDINFKDREIKVHTLKGGQGDKVYISDRLEVWLKKWLEEKKDNNPALFIVYQGSIRRLTGCMARKNIIQYRREFGIKQKLDHRCFRNGFCTNIMNQGANIKETQYLLRHRSERTTLKHYVKVQRGQVKSIHQSIFNNIFSKVKGRLFAEKQLQGSPR